MVGRVVDRVGVGQEHAEAGAELEQLVPVAVGAGQPAHLQAEDQADVVEGDLGQEPLEAGPALDRLAALAQVVVDRRDAVAGPAEGDGAVGQGVLAGGGLLMVDHLLGRGLADVDEGRAVEVPGPELGRAEGSVMVGLLAARGRQEPGQELAEQVAELPLPVGRQAGPDRSAWSPAGRDRSSGAGGSDGVGRWWAWGLSGWFDQVLSAPRGQFKQRGDADRNRRRGARTTCRLRWSLLGTSPPASGSSTAGPPAAASCPAAGC